MASVSSPALDALFRTLHKEIQQEDLKAIITSADKILKVAPGDPAALQIKCTALLRQSDFKAALELAAQVPDLIFEHAYALYRLNRYGECASLLSDIPNEKKKEGFPHLEAQVNYRLGNFSKCISIYEQLLKSTELDPELLTNVIAAYVSGGFPDKAIQLAQSKSKSVENTYEIVYNTACALVEKGDVKSASVELERAQKMCEAQLQDDDLTPAEMADELAVILVQMAYVAQLSGQTETALNMYTKVLNDKPSDSAVVATASNNIVTLRKLDEKLFDSLKRLDRALKAPHEKLSVRQRSAIQLNHTLLMFHGKKFDKCRELAEQMLKEDPANEVSVIIMAAIAVRDKKFDEAVKVLQDFLSHTPTSTQAALALAHVHLLSGNKSDAVSALRQSPSIRHKPAVVATLVSLLESLDDHKGASEVLDEAVKYWEAQGNAEQLAFFLERAAEYKFQHNLHSEAMQLYERLLNSGGKGKVNLAHLSRMVMASAKFDLARAEKLAKQLPALPGLQEVDVKALETISAPRVSRSAAGASDAAEDKEVMPVYDPSNNLRTKPVDAAAAAAKKDKKKKKKKKRLPKNFDPANPGPPPDPERWLPRWERSTNKKARKQRQRNQQLKGAQGATVDDKLDASAAGFATPAPAGPPSPSKKLPLKAGRRRK